MEFVGCAPLGPFIPAEYFVILELQKDERRKLRNRSVPTKFRAATSELPEKANHIT